MATNSSIFGSPMQNQTINNRTDIDVNGNLFATQQMYCDLSHFHRGNSMSTYTCTHYCFRFENKQQWKFWLFFCFTFIGRCDYVYFYCFDAHNVQRTIHLTWINLCNFCRYRFFVRSTHRNHRAAVHILWQHQHNCSYRQFIGNMDCGHYTNDADHHQSIHCQSGIVRCGHRDVCHPISGIYFIQFITNGVFIILYKVQIKRLNAVKAILRWTGLVQNWRPHIQIVGNHTKIMIRFVSLEVFMFIVSFDVFLWA